MWTQVKISLLVLFLPI